MLKKLKMMPIFYSPAHVNELTVNTGVWRVVVWSRHAHDEMIFMHEENRYSLLSLASSRRSNDRWTRILLVYKKVITINTSVDPASTYAVKRSCRPPRTTIVRCDQVPKWMNHSDGPSRRDLSWSRSSCWKRSSFVLITQSTCSFRLLILWFFSTRHEWSSVLLHSWVIWQWMIVDRILRQTNK